MQLLIDLDTDLHFLLCRGRLVLADALYYATHVYKPHTIIDAATLTGVCLTFYRLSSILIFLLTCS